jgi:GNAT superfamily N-acetyltransferase
MNPSEEFNIIEVKSKETRTEFLDFPSRIYKNEVKWSRPIDLDVEAIFDPLKNKQLRNGEAIRWILKDSSGNTVGRIGAFYERKEENDDDIDIGGVGFFDCINDINAASKLFDVGKEWLQSEGMVGMNGPVNLGMRDNFWGCLVDGFHEPVYNMPYNFPYYKELFEAYGFKNYFNQHTFLRQLNGDMIHPVIRRISVRILNNPDYEVRMIEKGNQRFARDFRIIYNQAWAGFSGIKEVTDEEAEGLLKEMTPIMDERLIYYTYYKGEPIAFFIMMPDIGQILKRFNGKWNLWNKLRFMWHLKVNKSVDRVIARIFGVVPEHQGKGVEGAMVLSFEKEVLKPEFKYKTLELNWIGDFNPVMMKVAGYIGCSIYKTHTTYRYLFDRNREFKRAPLVNMDNNK